MSVENPVAAPKLTVIPIGNREKFVQALVLMLTGDDKLPRVEERARELVESR